ncbi:cyclic pyranopterin monophosphate synthase MoaC [Alicyclobacillus sp.]|uniref:cyclic pyranopterin monophosphate synthase MoaC n=1 Tax=Alicyclobacillus sp. TaxID=61169 RepID=UPI0025BE4A51|nr:cyclic pyranopterin monophosphate synthase MoaC [Alicyclobacillus sp.]MCL6515795.1 cyclic pyranopterin monophosphate synthase MoaC [Alicyclobacillus sp.]
MSESTFTHFDEAGRPRMVDVTDKPETDREAAARARVRMRADTREKIEQGRMAKGDVLTIAELAGVMAAKRTADLIPLCHPVPLSGVRVTTAWEDAPEGEAILRIEARVRTTYRTGVEMEALTACSVAALTVYDMCKAVDRAMEVEHIGLIYKAGGKSGVFQRP